MKHRELRGVTAAGRKARAFRIIVALSLTAGSFAGVWTGSQDVTRAVRLSGREQGNCCPPVEMAGRLAACW